MKGILFKLGATILAVENRSLEAKVVALNSASPNSLPYELVRKRVFFLKSRSLAKKMKILRLRILIVNAAFKH